MKDIVVNLGAIGVSGWCQKWVTLPRISDSMEGPGFLKWFSLLIRQFGKLRCADFLKSRCGFWVLYCFYGRHIVHDITFKCSRTTCFHCVSEFFKRHYILQTVTHRQYKKNIATSLLKASKSKYAAPRVWGTASIWERIWASVDSRESRWFGTEAPTGSKGGHWALPHASLAPEMLLEYFSCFWVANEHIHMLPYLAPEML